MPPELGHLTGPLGRYGAATCARLMARAMLWLATTSFTAIALSSGPTQAQSTSQCGGWSRGNWYKEGAGIAPAPRSRVMANGVFVCRKSRWVFEPKQ